MTTRRRSTVSTRLAATVTLVVFVLAACGSSVTSIAADPVPEAAVPPAAAIGAPAAGGGHQYGATLEEWAGSGPQADASDDAEDVRQPGYEEIEWQDLIPPGASGEDLMARFEERLGAADIESAEAAELYQEMRAEYDPEAVNTQLDGQKIRLAGFVAPLTYDDDIVTEYLLVPTFGACIHVPPPPPNQTIMVSVDRADGLTLEESWGAIWVEGTLVIDSATTVLAPASYKITNVTSGPYQSF